MLYVNDLYKSYEVAKQPYEVLKGVSFHIAKGEFVAVMGPSGSGKSTLLNCISSYIPFERGTISLGGTELTNLSEHELAKVRNEKLGFVFQDFMLLDGLTVRENILVPRIIQGNVDDAAEAVADNLISLFGIGHIQAKYPAEISGGERQRTAVARSLINDPYMLLSDEPTGNLDSKSSRKVIEAFEHAKEQMGATIFMVTHDSFAASFCGRVILLKDGTIYRQLGRKVSRKEFQNQLLDTDYRLQRHDVFSDRAQCAPGGRRQPQAGHGNFYSGLIWLHCIYHLCSQPVFSKEIPAIGNLNGSRCFQKVSGSGLVP